MESWSYGLEGKGFLVSDEVISLADARERSGRVAMGWNSRTHCNFESTMLVPGRLAVDNQGGFMELCFPETIKKPLPDNPIGGGLDSQIGIARMASPTCVVSPKAFLEEDSTSRFSSSAVDSSSRDSALIDLKLGRLTDCRDAHEGGSYKQTAVMNSVRSSVAAKRTRTASLNSQTPYCQVLGCDLDLSSSKDYHKRHRVCEAHSKTAKVIVNGIEQRFCQQCSRFHLLAEFDDGKRSCRKRLAGHNERRRKPQFNHSSRTGKFLSMCQGNRFLETPFSSRTSFICPDIFPNSILHSTKYETGNWCKELKLEHETVDDPQSVIPVTNGLPRSFLSPYGSEEQYPSMNGNGIVTGPQGILFEKNNQYPHDLSSPNCISQSLYRNTISGSEDFTVFDTASTIQGLSGVSDSGCALSLLSSQSHNSSSHLSGNPLAQPLIQGSHAHQSIGSFPEKLLGVSSQASTSVASNKFSSSRMNSMEVDHMEPVLVSDDSNDFEVHTEGMFQGSDLVDAKDSFIHDQGPTVDLLQLSSHLQRVECQRHFLQVKQENDFFFCLPDT